LTQVDTIQVFNTDRHNTGVKHRKTLYRCSTQIDTIQVLNTGRHYTGVKHR